MQDDNFSLNGKSIVVTGAAQGIVRAIAQLALDLGATVTAVDLNAEALNAFADEAGHERLLPMSGSVADADFATQVVAQAAEKFGAVHGLVNNAGITRPAMIEKNEQGVLAAGTRCAPVGLVLFPAARGACA